MEGIHVFEVTGDVAFRLSGNFGYPLVECKVIKTTAWRRSDGIVHFVELSTGHSDYEFARWFSDDPDLGSNDVPFERTVEIAVPTWVYEQMQLSTGCISRQSGFSPTQTALLTIRDAYWFRIEYALEAPITAVKIDGVWEFPLPEQPRQLQPAPQ